MLNITLDLEAQRLQDVEVLERALSEINRLIEYYLKSIEENNNNPFLTSESKRSIESKLTNSLEYYNERAYFIGEKIKELKGE